MAPHRAGVGAAARQAKYTSAPNTSATHSRARCAMLPGRRLYFMPKATHTTVAATASAGQARPVPQAFSPVSWPEMVVVATIKASAPSAGRDISARRRPSHPKRHAKINHTPDAERHSEATANASSAPPPLSAGRARA